MMRPSGPARTGRHTGNGRPAAPAPPPPEPVPTSTGGRLIPPVGGAVIRMYRIGHGDCFLLALAGDNADDPRYVLIDCGYKPGSPAFIRKTTVKEIVDDIREATGGRLHVAVITHEHQDHVNGISEEAFAGIDIDQSWFAWTEDPADDLADQLRKKFRDRLVGLVAARNNLANFANGLAAAGDGAAARVQKQVDDIDDLLAFEIGGTDEAPFSVAGLGQSLAAAGGQSVGMSANKRSMAVFKAKAGRGLRFIRPHETVDIPGASAVRVYCLGPPRDTDLLHSLDPVGGEEFHSLAASSPGAYMASAAIGESGGAPFASRYSIPWDDAADHPHHGPFFAAHYGAAGGPAGPRSQPRPSATTPQHPDGSEEEAPDDAAWRRIDGDWLQAAGQLALDMNNDTNNSSLVLAFELGAGGKVLLFAGDAQRGNWMSWSQKDWPGPHGDGRVTARDLLARTVVLKVGHHGSHNATLNGHPDDEYANLSWIGIGAAAREFTALITAVRAWAETQKGWDHPLKAIKDALLVKASGRVIQTDTDLAGMGPREGSEDAWAGFLSRVSGARLFFDIAVEPD